MTALITRSMVNRRAAALASQGTITFWSADRPGDGTIIWRFVTADGTNLSVMSSRVAFELLRGIAAGWNSHFAVMAKQSGFHSAAKL